MHRQVVQIYSTTQNVDMYTLQMEAASVVVFPFVQCRLVAPLVVDGSRDSKSSCSVGINGFTSSGYGGFICYCSEELVVVLCGFRIRAIVAGLTVRFHWYCVLAVRGRMTGG